MATDWTHVRLRAVTHDRLIALLRILMDGEDGQYRPCMRHDPGAYVSVDAAITVLLDRVDAHRARAKRQRRGTRRAPIPLNDTPSPDGV